MLEFAQNIRKWASGFRFDMAGLPSIRSMVAAGRMQQSEIWWKITRFHCSWVGPSSSLRLGEFGEEFGGHCLPSYRVASHTIAVPHHCLPPTRVPHQIPHQSAAPETTPWCPSTSRPHQRAHTAGWALAEPHLQLNILPIFYKN